MRRYSLSLLAGCCLLAAGSASAGELRLTDKQLDNVTAGFVDFSDFGSLGDLFNIFFPQTPAPTGPVVIDDGEVVPVEIVTDQTTTNPDGSTTRFLVQRSLLPGRLEQVTLTTEFRSTVAGSGILGTNGVNSSLVQQ